MTKLFLLLAVSALAMNFAHATSPAFDEVMKLYSAGKYQATVQELTSIERKIKKNDRKSLGLIAYWKGLSYSRLQEFALAKNFFADAIESDFIPEDLQYEYAQALFALEDLKHARVHFNESFKQGFKTATCLYYMAYISKEIGERENARTLFNSLVKLDPVKAGETRQAAQMQLADMELEDAEKHPDVFRKVETEVIPEYEKALATNPESALGPRIKDKVRELQKKYDLVLFQLRNKRYTLIPPYFLRVAQEVGYDSNVTFAPAETTIAKAKQGSVFSKSEVFGRYTFYYKDFISYAPELRFNNTYYFHRIPEIYRNDNYLIAPALRTSYEHTLWNNPASVLFDYEYNEARRDVNARQELDFSSRAHVFMLGERFKYFSQGETTIRLRRRMFQSYLPQSDSTTTSLIMEQVMGLKTSTLLFYGSLDTTKVRNNLFDTNAVTLRGDWIMPRYKDWFNPSIGLSVTVTDPVNNRSRRGIENNFTPNVRLSRNIGKNWRLNTRLEHQRNNSKDKTSFAYKKNIIALELEYIF